MSAISFSFLAFQPTENSEIPSFTRTIAALLAEDGEIVDEQEEPSSSRPATAPSERSIKRTAERAGDELSDADPREGDHSPSAPKRQKVHSPTVLQTGRWLLNFTTAARQQRDLQAPMQNLSESSPYAPFVQTTR